ncbi:bifunctional orotidine-5'-phosphate decarboxylase/orotate phosphoribosyltransferase [Limnoraphis robusta]|uniref:Orotate phosphoribosyltransferase n=1 Tax=Limnoraphis robusta CCNP1315 TaxID=3110306 RepID=A0ABU5U827_9CYAN|nr:bifunctional orotidine-5'-phosphate decarboxylase/orotate phosphoribosyltransferase [Limnoraphis robusta]MEA5523319.1 bifunctional orotidine-5'-phosphate decarboxylase/orotate phosphoribosyltransferase [Limnoraphis robusta CCNP1315]MEA5544515.1 bifunctional orotidine-5'-phosphate decarboxylase/orotate phosphoribosyltransferase [Limnoraphis robusta CCNP1324]
MNFFDKLIAAIERNQSLLYVALDPNCESLSFNTDESVLTVEQWQNRLESVVDQTVDVVCSYKLNLGFYQALGWQGMQLLEQVLQLIPSNLPIILDAKYSDLNSSNIFARLIFEQWKIDACTVSPYTGLDQLTPFLVYPGKAVFVLCTTANPSATILQEYPTSEQSLYLQLVQETQTWGTPEQLGLEVGMMADTLARVRKTAPERLILLEGDTSEENDLMEESELTPILAAGLNENGEGLLLPVPHCLLREENGNQAVTEFRDRINKIRTQDVQGSPTCNLWLPDICFLEHQPHRDLILQLYDIGCIIFGEHVQSSGEVFPYYVDLRRIISIPQVFHQIVSAYAEILEGLEFDRIAGIPYGSLPTATGLALRMERPMIFPRKEVKSYGTGRLIEGHFQVGEKIVVIDDILITGNSVMQGAEKLKSAGLEVEDIVVFIDHGRGVMDKLKKNGYQGHTVLTLAEISETLYQANRISSQEFDLFKESTEPTLS